MIVKAAKKQRAIENGIAQGNLKGRVKIRHKRICNNCGKPRAHIRFFGICRICLRELARKGLIPGVRKASW